MPESDIIVSWPFQRYCACIADLPRVTELLLNFDSRWPEVPVDETQFELGVKRVLAKWVGDKRSALGASLDPNGNPIAVGDLMGGLLQLLESHSMVLRSDIVGCTPVRP